MVSISSPRRSKLHSGRHPIWDPVAHSSTATAVDNVITSAGGTQPYISKSPYRETAHDAAARGSTTEVTPVEHDVKFVDRLLASVKSDDNDDEDDDNINSVAAAAAAKYGR